ncbi:MAG: hypothetical protein AAGD40_09320 [Pseudomonadota bacterium]
MSKLTDMLASTPDIRNLPALQTRLIETLRMGAIAAKQGKAACCAVEARIGGPDISRRFCDLVAEVGRAWPEPFTINPPCQYRLSYDEMLFLDMMTAAAGGDRSTFDAMTKDMLPENTRTALYVMATRFVSLCVGNPE